MTTPDFRKIADKLTSHANNFTGSDLTNAYQALLYAATLAGELERVQRSLKDANERIAHILKCDHEWKWISDWYGDPDVINGTADCSRWECELCGETNEEMEAPSGSDFEDDYT